jgi:hypothetical protein
VNSSVNSEHKFVPNDPKSNKILSLKSSIFETGQNISQTLNQTTSDHLRTESVQEFKYPPTSDWKRLNTEILFLKEEKTDKKYNSKIFKKGLLRKLQS